MILSLFLGAFLYIIIQFFWYSPLGFGKKWLVLKQLTSEETITNLKQLGPISEIFQGVIFPAIVMSAAFHALFLVLSHFGTAIYVAGALTMTLSILLPKYRRWLTLSKKEQTLLKMSDGAFFTSLFFLILYILWAHGRLY